MQALRMKTTLLTAVAFFAMAFAVKADVTLDECINAAHDNYPLVKKYELLSATEDIALSDINKGWLPKVGVYAQTTVQNVVPSFPTALSNVMTQMGGDVRGLGKLQYKVGIDLNQTIWDGGASRAQREVTRCQTDVDRTSLDVEMYGIRQRVESLYFGILLLQSQIDQTVSSVGVYEANLKRLRSMFANGTAMQSDVDLVEAQLLSITQQLTSARAAVKSYRDMLSIFTGMNLADENLIIPNAEMPQDMTVRRPELSLFNARQALNASRRSSIDATLMPRIGFFAQTYYGYPGIDYFKAMMSRDLSFNVLAGVKVSWNIDSFYTKKNSLTKLDTSDAEINTQRETFMFNNSMQSASEIESIKGIEAVMKDDARIVELRRNVRMAAESQLRNGIIDATALTTKINDETQAALNASLHTIQRLQAIYNLKNTLNR